MKTIILYMVLATTVVLLAGCLGDKKESLELSALKTKLDEQELRIQKLESKAIDLAGKAEENAKSVAGLTEYVEAVKSSMQELSQSQEILNEKTESLSKLSAAVREIEERVRKLNDQSAKPVARKVASLTKPVEKIAKPSMPVEPPFWILGVEHRGQEPFLSIVRKGGRTLSDVKLVQPTELALDGWRLKSIEAGGARFVVDGHDFVVAIP